MNRLIELRESALDSEEPERAVAHDGAGAIVSFVGRVRNHNDGQPVTLLEYEAYASMAVKEMERIVEEVESRMPGIRLAVVHRLGRLNVGDAAIVCAASAAHRSEAFEACRQLIDEVKARVPIWKREHGPDGPYWVGWVDARCSGHEPAAANEQHASRGADVGHVGGQHRIKDSSEHHGCKHGHGKTTALPGDAHRSLEGLDVVCITVSDTRSLEDDESGALAGDLLAAAGASVRRHLVRDDRTDIAAMVNRYLTDSPSAIFLTGGTGIGPRDVTWEAIVPLCERTLDGFGEAFRRLSVEAIGTRGLLSRALAGTSKRSILFAVPGSPKAVELALRELVIPLLPHALAMLRGGGH